jgi:hypothetical protein
MSLELPSGVGVTHGTSIHTSSDQRPHLTGTLGGTTIHLPYHGQTTLGMFDRGLGAHKLEDVQALHERFPGVFKASGF